MEGQVLLIKTRVIDEFIVRLINDDHRNMWIGKFDTSTIENVYADTEGDLYKEIYNAIAKYKGLPIPYPDDKEEE